MHVANISPLLLHDLKGGCPKNPAKSSFLSVAVRWLQAVAKQMNHFKVHVNAQSKQAAPPPPLRKRIAIVAEGTADASTAQIANTPKPDSVLRVLGEHCPVSGARHL